MKKVIQLTLIAAMVVVGLASCHRDNPIVSDKLNAPYVLADGAADTIHELPDTICGNLVFGDLVDAQGNTGTGNLLGADIYGDWEMVATPDEMVVLLTFGRGWFASTWYVYMGQETNIPLDQTGNPDIEAFPFNGVVLPVRNNLEVRWPINQDMRCPNVVSVLCGINLVEIDFLGNPYNDHLVWLDGANIGTAGAQKITFCAEECPEDGPLGLPCSNNPVLPAICQQIPAVDNPAPTATYSGGSLTISNASDVVLVNGNVNLNTVNFNAPGTLIIGAGAVVSGGIRANNGGKLIVRGTFNWNSTVNLNQTFSMQIADGATLNKTGDFLMNSQTNVLINRGTLNIGQNLTYQGVVYNSGLLIANGFNLNSNSASMVNGEGGNITVAAYLNINSQAHFVNCGDIAVGNNLEINSNSTLINNGRIMVQEVTHNNAIFENYCYIMSGFTGTADGFTHQGTRTLMGDGSLILTRNFGWTSGGSIELQGNATITVAQSTIGVNNEILTLSGPSKLRVSGGASLTGMGNLLLSDMDPISSGDNPQGGTFPDRILVRINAQPQANIQIVNGSQTTNPYVN